MSCWWTTRSSADASPGKRPSASRCASLSVTTRPGPCTASSPASAASASARSVMAASAAAADGLPPWWLSTSSTRVSRWADSLSTDCLRLTNEVDEAGGVAAADLAAAGHGVGGGQQQPGAQAHDGHPEAPGGPARLEPWFLLPAVRCVRLWVASAPSSHRIARAAPTVRR